MISKDFTFFLPGGLLSEWVLQVKSLDGLCHGKAQRLQELKQGAAEIKQLPLNGKTELTGRF